MHWLWGLAGLLLLATPARADAPRTGDVAVLKEGDAVHLTLITQGGYAGFAVPGGWRVIAMQSRPPITATAFQLPDAADSGTPDSTNLIVSLLQPDTDQGRRTLAADARVYAQAAVSNTLYKDWRLHRRLRRQGDRTYTIIDGDKTVGDVIFRVRIAWPSLPGHGADHDAAMEAAFRAVLDSASGDVGTYAIHSGEIVRRPDPPPAP